MNRDDSEKDRRAVEGRNFGESVLTVKPGGAKAMKLVCMADKAGLAPDDIERRWPPPAKAQPVQFRHSPFASLRQTYGRKTRTELPADELATATNQVQPAAMLNDSIWEFVLHDAASLAGRGEGRVEEEMAIAIDAR